MGSTVTGLSQWYVEILKTLFTVNQFGGPKKVWIIWAMESTVPLYDIYRPVISCIRSVYQIHNLSIRKFNYIQVLSAYLLFTVLVYSLQCSTLAPSWQHSLHVPVWIKTIRICWTRKAIQLLAFLNCLLGIKAHNSCWVAPRLNPQR